MVIALLLDHTGATGWMMSEDKDGLLKKAHSRFLTKGEKEKEVIARIESWDGRSKSIDSLKSEPVILALLFDCDYESRLEFTMFSPVPKMPKEGL